MRPQISKTTDQTKETKMGKATKIRKMRKADGWLYRLDPPYVCGDQSWEVVGVNCHKAENYAGILSWPAFSNVVTAREKQPDQYSIGERLWSVEGRCLTHAQVLKQIGYTL